MPEAERGDATGTKHQGCVQPPLTPSLPSGFPPALQNSRQEKAGLGFGTRTHGVCWPRSGPFTHMPVPQEQGFQAEDPPRRLLIGLCCV